MSVSQHSRRIYGNKLKTEKFYVTVKALPHPQIRVTNGWWDSDATWTGARHPARNMS